MFTKFDSLISSYLVNKNNNHPAFIERNGIQNIIDDLGQELISILPHGAGIDADWHIVHAGQLVFACHNSYHVMDDGFYCGWVDFTIHFDAPTKTFDVVVEEKDIEAIEEDYKTMDENCDPDYDETFQEETSCPYLDDLEDHLYQSVEIALEYYYALNTAKFLKEHPIYKNFLTT